MKKRKKHKKHIEIRHLPSEAEMKARDKKIMEEIENARAEHLKKQRAQGKKPKEYSLNVIQKKGKSVCQDCGKEKPIINFYSYYNDLGELIKIFPMCKVCDRKHHRSGRSLVIEAQRKGCLEHYGKAKSSKLCCISCKNNDFRALVLFSSRHRNTRAIATDKTYSMLYNFKYPDVKYTVLCFNCAYIKIYDYKNQTHPNKGE